MTIDQLIDPHRLARLRGCHPELAFRVKNLIDALAHQGFTVVITQGVRSVAQQQALYAQGRTKPGKVVTACDGVRKPSNHQPKADGYGYAVDVAWMTPAGITWEGPWPVFGELAAAHGLKWGGNFVSFQDRPHLEYAP